MSPNLLISRKELSEYERISSWRGPLRFLIEAGIILVTMYIASSSSAFYWPILALIIASRQHALLVLMHEAAHETLTPWKFMNNLVGEFIAFNHLMLMRGYKRHHKLHHALRNLNTLQDPDFARKQNKSWEFPMKKKKLLEILLRDVLMLNTYDYIQEAKDAKNNVIENKADLWVFRIRAIYYVVFFALITAYNLWPLYLAYWILPVFTFLKAILRIRSIADHFVVPNKQLIDRTRTILPPWWERLIIAPCNIGIHNEHHLYANVPYYNLEKLHRRLLLNNTYKETSVISKSYFSTLSKECCL